MGLEAKQKLYGKGSEKASLLLSLAPVQAEQCPSPSNSCSLGTGEGDSLGNKIYAEVAELRGGHTG